MRIWDRNNFGLVGIFGGHSAGITDIFVDNRYIYTGSADNTVIIRNVESFTVRKVLKGSNMGIRKVFADPYNIYTISGDKILRIYNRRTFNESFIISDFERTPSSVISDGNRLYLTVGPKIEVIELKGADYQKKEPIDFGTSVDIGDFFLDAGYIYAVLGDRKIIVWSRKDKRVVKTYRVKDSPVKKVYADDDRIYAGCKNGTLIIWNRRGVTREKIINEHNGSITDIYVDSDYVYTVSDDKTLVILDRETLNKVKIIECKSNPVNGLYVDDKYIYWASDNGTVTVRNKSAPLDGFTVKIGNGAVNAVVSDGEKIYAASSDGNVYIYDMESGEIREKLTADNRAVKTVYAEKGEAGIICAGTGGAKLIIWEKKNTKKIFDDKIHRRGINSVFVDDKHIYTASSDRTVNILDYETLEVVETLRDHKLSVNSVVGDDKYIYTASDDGSVIIRRKEDLKKIKTLEMGGSVTTISADADFIYIGLKNGILRIIKGDTFETLKELSVHTDRITSIVSDKKFVYSAARDNTVTVIDRRSLTPVIRLPNIDLSESAIYEREGAVPVFVIFNVFIAEYDITRVNTVSPLIADVIRGKVIPVTILNDGLKIDEGALIKIRKLYGTAEGPYAAGDGTIEEGEYPFGRTVETGEGTAAYSEGIIPTKAEGGEIGTTPSEYRCLKVMLIGSGTQGKTTLLYRIIKDRFVSDEYDETVGLEIHKINAKELPSLKYCKASIRNEIDRSPEELLLTFYDFGGQSKYHYAHSFFLTPYSLILLTVNLRQPHTFREVEYWLKMMDNAVGLDKLNIITVCTHYNPESTVSDDLENLIKILIPFKRGLENNIYLVDSKGRVKRDRSDTVDYIPIGFSDAESIPVKGSFGTVYVHFGLMDILMEYLLRSPLHSPGRIREFPEKMIGVLKERGLKLISFKKLNSLLRELTEGYSDYIGRIFGLKYGAAPRWSENDLDIILYNMHITGDLLYYKFRGPFADTDPLIVTDPGLINRLIFYFRKRVTETGIPIVDGPTLREIIDGIIKDYRVELFGKNMIFGREEREIGNYYSERDVIIEYLPWLFIKFGIITKVGTDDYLIIDTLERPVSDPPEWLVRRLKELEERDPDRYDTITVEWDGFVVGFYRGVFSQFSSSMGMEGIMSIMVDSERRRTELRKTIALYRIGTIPVTVSAEEELAPGSGFPILQRMVIRIFTEPEISIRRYRPMFMAGISTLLLKLGITVENTENLLLCNVTGKTSTIGPKARIKVKKVNIGPETEVIDKTTGEILQRLEELIKSHRELKENIHRQNEVENKIYGTAVELESNIRELKEGLKVMGEEIKSFITKAFTRTVSVIGEITDKCPRVFIIREIRKTGFARLRFYEKDYIMEFFCEKCWSSRGYGFSMKKEWAAKIFPWLGIVLKVMGTFIFNIKGLCENLPIEENLEVLFNKIGDFEGLIGDVVEEIGPIYGGSGEEDGTVMEKEYVELVESFKSGKDIRLSRSEREELCKIINGHKSLSRWKEFLEFDHIKGLWLCKECRENP